MTTPTAKQKHQPGILKWRAIVPPSGCAHPDHEGKRRVDVHSTFWYQDKKHRFPYEGPCCRKCYARHILKHYPESSIADYIRKHPDEYKNTYATKTKKVRRHA